MSPDLHISFAVVFCFLASVVAGKIGQCGDDIRNYITADKSVKICPKDCSTGFELEFTGSLNQSGNATKNSKPTRRFQIKVADDDVKDGKHVVKFSKKGNKMVMEISGKHSSEIELQNGCFSLFMSLSETSSTYIEKQMSDGAMLEDYFDRSILQLDMFTVECALPTMTTVVLSKNDGCSHVEFKTMDLKLLTPTTMYPDEIDLKAKQCKTRVIGVAGAWVDMEIGSKQYAVRVGCVQKPCGKSSIPIFLKALSNWFAENNASLADWSKEPMDLQDMQNGSNKHWIANMDCFHYFSVPIHNPRETNCNDIGYGTFLSGVKKSVEWIEKPTYDWREDFDYVPYCKSKMVNLTNANFSLGNVQSNQLITIKIPIGMDNSDSRSETYWTQERVELHKYMWGLTELSRYTGWELENNVSFWGRFVASPNDAYYGPKKVKQLTVQLRPVVKEQLTNFSADELREAFSLAQVSQQVLRCYTLYMPRFAAAQEIVVYTENGEVKKSSGILLDQAETFWFEGKEFHVPNDPSIVHLYMMMIVS